MVESLECETLTRLTISGVTLFDQARMHLRPPPPHPKKCLCLPGLEKTENFQGFFNVVD